MNGAAARWHRYWHGFALERERIVALRVAFFGLLTFDMWGLMLGHAARYGAGDFNAAQLEIIDRLLPIPTPAAVAAGWLLGGFFALRTALGIAPRTSAIGTAICYAGIYFWSQADSYQHHYLLAMLLILMAFVPTRVWAAAPRHDDPPDTPRSPVAHWVLRLIYVQIALMYFWTGVTKADPTWLTGATIDQLTTKLAIRDAIVAFEQARGWDHGTVYHLMAWAVMLGELSAPIFFLSRKLRVIGLFIVPWFHVGVEILNFDIEWFSYYMIALDVILLMPSAGWRAIGEVVRGTRRIWQPLLAPQTVPSTVQMVLALGSGALCGWLASRIEVHGATTVGAVVAGASILALWPLPRLRPTAPWTAAVLQVGIALLMGYAVHAFEAAYDMYRMWGGDLRRRGQIEEAIDRYEHANALMPGKPARRYQLAQLHERAGRADQARALYEEAYAIQKAHVDRLATETLRHTTDPDLYFELAEDQLRLIERCEAVARVRRRAGEADGAEEADRCVRTARLDAGDAIKHGRELAPRSREGARLASQLQRMTRSR